MTMEFGPAALSALAESVSGAVAASGKKETTYSATVLRTDNDGTTWVHIAGGADETPLHAMLVEAGPGDVVRVSISDGRATAVGNLTSPSATSRTVGVVEGKAQAAQETADAARSSADDAAAAASSAQASAHQASQDAATAHSAATGAQQSADAAGAAASAAVQSASTANANADAAGQAASQAVQDAATANANATAAQQSAATANSNASAAQSAAQSAQQSASTANANADSAITSATAAAAAASTAQLAAEATQTDLDLLQTHFWRDEDGAHVRNHEDGYQTDLGPNGMTVNELSTGSPLVRLGAEGLDFFDGGGGEEGNLALHVSQDGVSLGASHRQDIGSTDAYVRFTPADGDNPARLDIVADSVTIGRKPGATADDVAALQESVDQASSDASEALGFVNGTVPVFFDFSEYEEAGATRPQLTLGGGSDSDMKLRLRNDRIDFVDASGQEDAVPAYLSASKLYIDEAEVVGRLGFGGWEWTERLNGHMTLRRVM